MARAGGDMVLVVAGTDPLEILFTSFSHVRVCDTASKCRSSYTDVQRVSFPPSYLFFRLSRFSIPRLGIEMETSLRSRPVISRIGDERRWPDRRGSGPSVRAQMAQLVAVLSRIRCLSYAFQCLGWLWTALDGFGRDWLAVLSRYTRNFAGERTRSSSDATWEYSRISLWKRFAYNLLLYNLTIGLRWYTGCVRSWLTMSLLR